MVRICERCLNPEVNVLDLEVYGGRFPNFYNADEVPQLSESLQKYVKENPLITFKFKDELSASKGIEVDFNDGIKSRYYPEPGENYISFSYNSNYHTFTTKQVWHNIKVKFVDIEGVIGYDTRYVRGRNELPRLERFTNLKEIVIVNANGRVESYAENLGLEGYSDVSSNILKLYNLSSFTIDGSLLIGSKPTKALPLGLFNTSIGILNYGGNSFRDVATNNFDKLPLLSSTLYDLKLSNNDLTVDSFPENWKSNTKIKTLWLHGFVANSRSIGNLLLSNIELLYMISKDTIGVDNDTWLDIPVDSKLANLTILGALSDPSKLPSNLNRAIKLKYISFGHSVTSICLLNTTEKVTAWWNNWYTFITIFASMDANAPDQKFRGITFDFRGGSVGSPIVMPNGYVQGVSNGTPTTIGQKIWVLDNQYGHHNSYTP